MNDGVQLGASVASWPTTWGSPRRCGRKSWVANRLTGLRLRRQASTALLLMPRWWLWPAMGDLRFFSSAEQGGVSSSAVVNIRYLTLTHWDHYPMGKNAVPA